VHVGGFPEFLLAPSEGCTAGPYAGAELAERFWGFDHDGIA
jgi:hypothetical protein